MVEIQDSSPAIMAVMLFQKRIWASVKIFLLLTTHH